jgi:hypothetical protein
MPGQAIPKPGRRWLRVSARGLIVLVFGAVLGWVVRSARDQRDAVRAIEEAGGSVEYDWHENVRGETWLPGWLVDRVGIDYCLHVDYVSVAYGAANQQFAHVGADNRTRDDGEPWYGLTREHFLSFDPPRTPPCKRPARGSRCGG